jgi:hypothetical protein
MQLSTRRLLPLMLRRELGEGEGARVRCSKTNQTNGYDQGWELVWSSGTCRFIPKWSHFCFNKVVAIAVIQYSHKGLVDQVTRLSRSADEESHPQQVPGKTRKPAGTSVCIASEAKKSHSALSRCNCPPTAEFHLDHVCPPETHISFSIIHIQRVVTLPRLCEKQMDICHLWQLRSDHTVAKVRRVAHSWRGVQCCSRPFLLSASARCLYFKFG